MSLASFYQWRRRLRLDASAPARPAAPAFLPVRVVPQAAGTADSHPGGGVEESQAAIEIIVSRRRRVRVETGFDAATLGRVLAVLEGQAC